MPTLYLLLLMFSFGLLVLAAIGVASGRYNLIAAGLACYIASMLFAGFR